MPTNGLLIDYEYCSGCHSCEVACRNELGLPLDQWGIKMLQIGPFVIDEEKDKFEWNYYPMVTSLCNLCSDRVAKGESPSCVLHCLASAIEYGPIEELTEKMKKKGGKMYVITP